MGNINLKLKMVPIFLLALMLANIDVALAGWTDSGNDMYNSNSGKVGIGTTTPGEKLHICVDNGNPRLEIEATTAGHTGVILFPNFTNGTNWQILSTSPLGTYSSLNGGFLIYNATDDINAFSIKDTGNVGIGTINPQGRLHVTGGAALFQEGTNVIGLANVENFSGTPTTGGSLSSNTYYYKAYPVTSGGKVGRPSNEISVVVNGGYSAVALSWNSLNGAAKYRVSRSTISGSQDGYYEVTTTSYTDTGAAFTGSGNAFTEPTSRWLELGGGLTLPASSGAISWLNYTDNAIGGFIGVTSAGEMEFKTGTGSAQGDYVFENQAGAAKFKIRTNLAPTELIYTDGTNATEGVIEASPLWFRIGGSERLRITGTGNVGIGTNNPDSTLELGGTTAAISLNENTTTPAAPAADTEARIYVKADKLIVQWNQGGTVRYKYLLLSGTGTTWTHTTTAP